MRSLLAIFWILILTLCTAHAMPAWSAARDRGELEQELRGKAKQGTPGAKRELACFLYLTAEENSPRAQEAYTNMQAAADAGDNEALLYASAYLRMGFGVKRRPAAAASFLASLQDHIGRSQSFPLTNLREAADALQSGRCAPKDEEGAAELYTLRPALTPLLR